MLVLGAVDVMFLWKSNATRVPDSSMEDQGFQKLAIVQMFGQLGRPGCKKT